MTPLPLRGNSAAHLKSSLTFSLTLIGSREPVLGAGRVFPGEFDGPDVKVHMQVIPPDNGKKGDGE